MKGFKFGDIIKIRTKIGTKTIYETAVFLSYFSFDMSGNRYKVPNLQVVFKNVPWLVCKIDQDRIKI